MDLSKLQTEMNIISVSVIVLYLQITAIKQIPVKSRRICSVFLLLLNGGQQRNRQESFPFQSAATKVSSVSGSMATCLVGYQVSGEPKVLISSSRSLKCSQEFLGMSAPKHRLSAQFGSYKTNDFHILFPFKQISTFQ